jgi:hypothetical protein
MVDAQTSGDARQASASNGILYGVDFSMLPISFCSPRIQHWKGPGQTRDIHCQPILTTRARNNTGVSACVGRRECGFVLFSPACWLGFLCINTVLYGTVLHVVLIVAATPEWHCRFSDVSNRHVGSAEYGWGSFQVPCPIAIRRGQQTGQRERRLVAR